MEKNSKKSGWRVFFAYCLVLLMAVLGGCADHLESPTRVGTNQWPGYEPLYLAEHLGHFGEGRVRMVQFTSTSEVMNALRNGLIEAGGLTLDEALSLQSEGIDLRVVLVMDVSDGADVILGHEGMEDMSDLEGKRVGYESTALGAFMLSQGLHHAGLSFSDIEPVSLTIDEHRRAFLDGQVDAVVTFDPARSQLLDAGAVELFSSSQIPGRVVDVLAVRGEVLEEQPGRLNLIVEGWFDALDWMEAHPRQALERMAPRLGIPPDQLEHAYRGMQLPDAERNRHLLGGEAPVLADTIAELRPVLESQGLLEGPVDADRLLTPRLVED